MNISNISKENVHKLSNRVLDQNQNNNGIAEKLIPYPKHVLEDLELEYKCNEIENKYREEHDGQFKSFREEYPYKQLWYNRQCENWGQKWGLCDVYLNWTDNNNGVQECCLSGRTPWGPEEPVVKKLSEVFDCDIEYCFEESGMGFSGIYNYSKGELESKEDYDDAYYGNGKDCEICGCMYDLSNPDDWYEQADYVGGTGKRNICIYCGEKLENKK